MFIEVTDRRDATFIVILNTANIVRVTNDGQGAIITYRSQASENDKGIEILAVVETYAAIRTALGL